MLTSASEADEYYRPLLDAIKTLKYHKDDLTFNIAKIDKATEIAQKLLVRLPQENPMVQHYWPFARAIQSVKFETDPIIIKQKIDQLFNLGNLSRFTPPMAAVDSEILKKAGFTVIKRNPLYEVREAKNGISKVIQSEEFPNIYGNAKTASTPEEHATDAIPLTKRDSEVLDRELRADPSMTGNWLFAPGAGGGL